MEYTVKNLASYMNRCRKCYETRAHNLANSSSGGFKKWLVIERAHQQETRIDLSQGQIRTTGNPLDVAIQGNAFFVVNTTQGARYTRNGCFKLNAAKELVNSAGLKVLGKKGRPIVIQGKPAIDENGKVYSDGEPVDDLVFVRPKDSARVQSLDGNLYNFEPEFAKTGQFTADSGLLEGSNVNPLNEMTAVLNFTRNFEIAQRIMKIDNNLGDKCAVDIGNTGT